MIPLVLAVAGPSLQTPKVNTNLWRALNTGKNISAFRKEDHNASYAAITWQTIEMKVQNKITV